MTQKLVFLLHLLFAVSGSACSTYYLMQYPDLDPNIADAIRTNTVIPGMNTEQVLLVLGEPSAREEGEWRYYWVETTQVLMESSKTARSGSHEITIFGVPATVTVSTNISGDDKPYYTNQPTGTMARYSLEFSRDKLVKITRQIGMGNSPGSFFPFPMSKPNTVVKLVAD